VNINDLRAIYNAAFYSRAADVDGNMDQCHEAGLVAVMQKFSSKPLTPILPALLRRKEPSMSEWETYSQMAKKSAKCVEENERMRAAIGEALSYLGPSAPNCAGCEYEWNEAIRVLKKALK
jgi:hypothetical protein